MSSGFGLSMNFLMQKRPEPNNHIRKITDPHMRIGRPRQLYTGAPRRDYLPIGKRT